MARIMENYRQKVLPELKKELGLGNDLAAPRLEKIIVNAGIGKLLQQNPKALEGATDVLRKITGQQPVANRAKKAISAFKIREGQIVGLSVTLRGKRMYEFFDKLVNVALPRTRDFRGLSRKGFDGRGNYSLGLRENLIFPELAQEEGALTFGLEAVIVTSAGNDNGGYLLLKKLGFPFKD